jgi:adenylate cyclase, class 2
VVEVELKFRILPTDWPKIREKLGSMQFLGRSENDDRYYDTQGFDFLQQAVFVRVRNQRLLECKFNERADLAHVQCTERVFPLEPELHQAEHMNALFRHFYPSWQHAMTVKEAIQKNNLRELACIKNTRKQYGSENLVACVDHVEGLGDYFELETQIEKGRDTSCAVAKLQGFVADLALERIPVGYVELWLRLHHAEAYQRGRYKL